MASLTVQWIGQCGCIVVLTGSAVKWFCLGISQVNLSSSAALGVAILPLAWELAACVVFWDMSGSAACHADCASISDW